MQTYEAKNLMQANVLIQRNVLGIFKSLKPVEGESNRDRFVKAFDIGIKRLVQHGFLVQRFGELQLTPRGIKRASDFHKDVNNYRKIRELHDIGKELGLWV